MSEAANLGRCLVCGKALLPLRNVLARQTHCIEYTLRGDTPNDQAVLSTSMQVIKASFCGKACRDQALPRLLTAQGLAPEFEHNRLEGGPICPCGKCGAPVNMTQPHVAWVKGECHLTQADSGWRTDYQWLDVLAVLCVNCAGAVSTAQTAQPAVDKAQTPPASVSRARRRADAERI